MTISAGYPNDLFKNKSPEQTEVLFQATPVAVGGFLGYSLKSAFYHVATNDIASILRENSNDVRKNWVKDTTGSRIKVVKFPSSVAGALFPVAEGDYYSPVLRSSEMFLIAAEASMRTGNENDARMFLNAIRRRANTTISDVTATGPALLDSIYKERRKELCFEGTRMFDLQRWKLGVQRQDVFQGYQSTLLFPDNKAISPIPGQDVNLMRLSQNDGY
ncbi:RagB/SusD family nutrient uptake outer membrane protein [Niastella yeongjuensis]